MPKKQEKLMSQMEYWNMSSTALDTVIPVPMWVGVQDWDLLDDEVQNFYHKYPWLDA